MADVSPTFMAPSTAGIGSQDASAVERADTVSPVSNGLFCEVCSKELTYGGRGRKPKRCDEHKKSGSNNSTPDKPPSSTVPKGLNKIREDLTEVFFIAGVAITPYDQFDGAVLIGGGPKVADSLVALAARYPKFRQFLEKGGDGMLWVKVVTGLSTIAVPIMAHHGLIPMDEKLAYQKFVDPTVEI